MVVCFLTDLYYLVPHIGNHGLFISLHQAVRESVQASADDSVLKCLIDLADTCPKLLRANLEQILDLMLEVRFTQHLVNLFCKCAKQVVNVHVVQLSNAGSGSRSLVVKPFITFWSDNSSQFL